MKRIKIYFLFLILTVSSCSPDLPSPANNSDQNLLQWVDPFIGTGGHGHTYPGAVAPFGMVQLSPDGDTEGWDWCSGYHDSDRNLMGFSHTHLSGTGIGDMGDVLLMPFTGKDYWAPGPKDNPDAGYRSRFDKNTESASPGYYSVDLADHKVKVELTASERAGFHRYTFPSDSVPKVILDLEHGIGWDEAIDTHMETPENGLIMGHRFSTGWAKNQKLFFALKTHLEWEDLKMMEVDSSKAILSFAEGEENLMIKVGISYTSSEAALANLEAEIPHWDFDKVRTETEGKWQKELQKVQVSGGTDREKRIFYTGLYHAFLVPQLFNDVDGAYRGADDGIHPDPGFDNYSVFSLWDTFRAEMPLFTLLQEERLDGIYSSILQFYKESGLLPKWSLVGNETNTMIGYHAVPVLGEAIMKELDFGNENEILEAMIQTANQEGEAFEAYRNLGYFPADKASFSASATIEHSYDDWVISEVARKLGNEEVANQFKVRGKNYKNLFDPQYGYLRGKNSDGSWVSPYAPADVQHSGVFIEGNAMQYSWFVPHDVAGLMEVMGGREQFKENLDTFFSFEIDSTVKFEAADVTGLIGLYAHGNEPSHHIAYLYNELDEYQTTQRILKQIYAEMYDDKPDGLSGNEDCGQMSAWYIFSAMGFYPLNPVSAEYNLGSPIFDSIKVKTGSLDFEVKKEGSGPFQEVLLNDNPIENFKLKHSDLQKGSVLTFKPMP
ncbi:GH92 family glycosyl hydrolase [Algoriphagus sediminis]|uniref:GH92 family glycosyl hydrolase n=1 Tax=Algoriphagus sediminis TaxID=3057113 RepID=A0ABT7Y7X5_9BACT|nr:GH92 family glycosyl hydrolase [Algoriphagus sediminis]MDN3202614.1 GH92 family glycosyl hydrolase [Algoriphagus sediminis]